MRAADRAASREPRVRELPRDDGSAGPVARELRPRRALAHRRRGARAHRRLRCAARRHEVRGTVRASRDRAAGKPDRFVRTLTEKLLTYALGRGLEYYDMPAVRKIARDAAQHEYRASVLILGHRQQSSLPDAEAAVMIITKNGVTPADVPSRLGRGVRAAAARRDGAGVFGDREERREADLPPRIHLRAERRGHERQPQLLDAERLGHRTSSFSPILAPLAPYRDRLTIVSGLAQKQGESLGDGNGEHTRACATWLNGVHPKKTEGADIRLGDDGRSDRRGTARQGDRAAVDGDDLVGNRSRARRPVRSGLQLRVHEHRVVAVADDPAAGREQPERGLRAAVRRGRHAAKSGSIG